MTGAAHPGFSVKFVGVDELDRSVSEMQKPRTLSINANLFRSVFVLLPQTRHPERSAFVLLPQTRHPERSAFVLLPQTRHPERSASQIDRMTQRFWRGVEGPRRCLFCRYWSELSTIEPRAGRDPLRFVPVAETNNLKDVSVTMKSVSQQILLSASVSKSSQQYGQNKHRRGPSTPRHKRCVTQSIGEALRSG